MSGDVRPDRHALLELDALLAQIESLVAEGDRARFDSDDRYRWILHRLWIAVGNEALAYVRLAGLNVDLTVEHAELLGHGFLLSAVGMTWARPMRCLRADCANLMSYTPIVSDK